MAQTSELTFAGYGGDAVAGALAVPDHDARRPGMVVLSDIHGLSDHFRDVAGRFAAAGYTALAIDMFARTGPPSDHEPATLGAFLDHLADQQVLDDVRAATAFLRARPDATGRVGCIGFCLGGLYTQMAMAMPGGPDAGVDLYGRLRHGRLSQLKPQHPIDVAERTRGPLLALFGARDPVVPRGHIETLRRTLTATGQPFDIQIYPEAGHAFFDDSRPELYHAGSAADAWERILAWFGEHLR